MKVCEKRQQVRAFLAENVPEEASIGLCFMRDGLTPGDLVAVRQASRVCDVAVVVAYGDFTADVASPYLEQAGASCLLLPTSGNSARAVLRTRADVAENIDLVVMLQDVLAIMPSVVTVSLSDLVLMQAVTGLNDLFDALFTFMPQQVPESALDAKSLEVRAKMVAVQEIYANGERDAAKLVEALRRLLLPLLLEDEFSLCVTDKQYFAVKSGIVQHQPALLHVDAVFDGERISDAVWLKT